MNGGTGVRDSLPVSSLGPIILTKERRAGGGDRVTKNAVEETRLITLLFLAIEIEQ